ncbi:MAG: tetratricopeptide repeat protein [Desulfomonilia bacterium]|jgi:tetratricopeptide (TPR) repeat protein
MRRSNLFHVLVMMFLVVALVGCIKSPEQKRHDYLTSAQKYVTQKKYAEAAIQYQNALKIAPDDAKTLVSLGEAQLKLNRPREAYVAFFKASTADPKNVKAQEYLASMLLLAKKYDMAEKQAYAILGKDPKNTLAKKILAQSQFMGGKREQGIKVMEELIKSSSPTEDMYFDTIQMYMTVGKSEDALALVLKACALFPKSTRIRFLASNIYAFMNDINNAKKWAEEAYRVSDGNLNTGIELTVFYARHKMDALYHSQLSTMKIKYPTSPEPYLLESSILHQNRDLDGALKAAQKARELKDTTQVRTQIAQILLEKNDVAQAKKLLTETVQKDPEDIQSKILLTQIFLGEKDSTKAIEMMAQPLKIAPEHPMVASTAAQAYLLKGDVKKAKELVENALKKNDRNIQLHEMMAKIYFLQGQFKDALSETNLFVKHSVKTPDIMYIGALSALRTSDSKDASAYIQSLKEVVPNEWITLHAQIQYLLSQKDKKNAYAIAERAITLYPRNDEALALYAYTAPGNIGLQEAITRLNGICSKAESSGCHMILSALFEESGKKSEALAEIKKAIGMEPGKPPLYHALGQFYARNNMLKDALDEYEKILKKNPDDLQAANMLALLNQQVGKTDNAKKYYQYILDKNPKNALAANNMAWLLAESGKKEDLENALKYAQTAKDMYPEDPRIADTLGYVYLKKGLPENALGQFQLALEKLKEDDPDDPTILYHTALALVDLGRGKEAVQYLMKSTSSKKQFPEKQQALELLAKLQSGLKK